MHIARFTEYGRIRLYKQVHLLGGLSSCLGIATHLWLQGRTALLKGI